MKDHITKDDFISSELLILLQLNLVLMVNHRKLNCLVKGLDCFVVVKVKVTGKVKNSDEVWIIFSMVNPGVDQKTSCSL